MWKKLKIIFLKIEYLVRVVSYIYGFGISFILIYAHLETLNVVQKNIVSNVNTNKDIVSNADIAILFSITIFPILACIFFLIATRKFKELNTLIKEHKNL